MKNAIRYTSALLLSVAAGCSVSQGDGSKLGLLNCMSAIQTASGGPSRAKVPYVKDSGSAGEHYFAWPDGSGLILPSRDGTAQPASASCVTDAAGIVTNMTINGSEIPIR
ncbi:hypothetical protein [Stenotrophomonas sp.]|uniref:hypothetical protein n=1 Tax=Stenotrophomonas sp. TaxID=69392 RepID=UPI002898D432|nr:hypothetical protein [Stenotrophomonas sp.]